MCLGAEIQSNCRGFWRFKDIPRFSNILSMNNTLGLSEKTLPNLTRASLMTGNPLSTTTSRPPMYRLKTSPYWRRHALNWVRGSLSTRRRWPSSGRAGPGPGGIPGGRRVDSHHSRDKATAPPRSNVVESGSSGTSMVSRCAVTELWVTLQVVRLFD